MNSAREVSMQLTTLIAVMAQVFAPENRVAA
jgi:hypothetical protein